MMCLSCSQRQQSEEGDKNGSEDEDEEKPGKRVMGPRKKFVWDDKLRCRGRTELLRWLQRGLRLRSRLMVHVLSAGTCSVTWCE